MKLANKVIEALKPYNGKVKGFNGEAGDTSMDHDHYHKTMIDADGNGKTIKTMWPNWDGLAQDQGQDPEDDHVHTIVNYEVQEANGHTHEIIG